MANFFCVVKKDKGFTFIEVLISIAILVVALTGFMPLYKFIIASSENNRVRLLAANLANKTIEEIRSLPFNEIGVEGGNPQGRFPALQFVVIDGREFIVEININWLEEGGCSEVNSLSSNASWDYKSLLVKVSSTKNYFGEPVVEELSTLVARNSSQPAIEGANIRICALRGWKENIASTYESVSGVKVIIEGPEPSTVTEWVTTTERGSALFLDCAEGDYTVYAEPPLNMMILPDSIPFKITATNALTVGQPIYLEYPCYLKMNIYDLVTGEVVQEDGKIILNAPFFKKVLEKNFANGKIEEDLLGPIWPLGSGYPGEYSLEVVNVTGYHDFLQNVQKPIKVDGSEWNGTFESPGTTLALKVGLIPIPAAPPENEALFAKDLGWFNGNSHVINQKITARAEENGVLKPVIFRSGSNKEEIKLTAQKSDFTALAMYFEKDLQIMTNAELVLRADLITFSGYVQLERHNNEKRNGKLRLYVTGDGIDGSKIANGQSGVKYGEVHFVEGLKLGDNILKRGAYYFPNGISLADKYEQLIPWQPID